MNIIYSGKSKFRRPAKGLVRLGIKTILALTFTDGSSALESKLMAGNVEVAPTGVVSGVKF